MWKLPTRIFYNFNVYRSKPKLCMTLGAELANHNVISKKQKVYFSNHPESRYQHFFLSFLQLRDTVDCYSKWGTKKNTSDTGTTCSRCRGSLCIQSLRCNMVSTRPWEYLGKDLQNAVNGVGKRLWLGWYCTSDYSTEKNIAYLRMISHDNLSDLRMGTREDCLKESAPAQLSIFNEGLRYIYMNLWKYLWRRRVSVQSTDAPLNACSMEILPLSNRHVLISPVPFSQLSPPALNQFLHTDYLWSIFSPP